MTFRSVHLSDAELVDLLDDALAPARRAHVRTCEACRRRERELRETLEQATIADVPDPGDEYWTDLSRSIRSAVDREPEPRSALWSGLSGRWVLAGATAAAFALFFVVSQSDRQSNSLPTPPAAVEQVASSDPVDADDEAWSLVQTLADDLAPEDLGEAGIATDPTALDRATGELSAEERVAFAHLLAEITTTGPTEPMP